jgi:hypothetical protein
VRCVVETAAWGQPFSPSISLFPSVSIIPPTFHIHFVYRTINAQNIVWVSARNRRIHKNFEILKYREKFQIRMQRKTRKMLFFLRYQSVCIHGILHKYINFLDNNLAVIKLRFPI